MTPNAIASSGPPRAPLAFRVGVVGHRPDRLKQADLSVLSTVMRKILSAVKEAVWEVRDTHPQLYADALPVLRAISPLAEGSDRLFAEQALDLGYGLICPLPFLQEEFERDFAAGKALVPDSLGHFRTLLDRANRQTSLSLFELDGNRDDVGAAYGAAGNVVLNQSDVLVVVWDGQRLAKSGGTEETFEEARRRGVPIVWVDAHAPHALQIIDVSTVLPDASTGRRSTRSSDAPIPKLKETVKDTLALPPQRGPAGESGRHSGKVVLALGRLWGAVRAKRRGHGAALSGSEIALADFYAEKKPRVNPALVWRFFRDVVGESRWSLRGFAVLDFETAVKDEWPDDESSPTARIVHRLRPFYAWPDKLAVHYSDTYRSAFLVAYTFAALAVGMALLPVAADWFGEPPRGGETASIVSELLMILIILVLVLRGRARRWHERWIDYRLAAELVRHLRVVVSLGASRPFPQLPAHLATYGHPGSTWASWYVRAVERDLGLPPTRVTPDHLKECLRHLEQVIAGQVRFHEKNAERCYAIEHRLHLLALLLLSLTLLACGLHLLPSVWSSFRPPHWLPRVLVSMAGFLPAAGAALAGINNQGEFLRIAKRSAAMERQLSDLLASAKALSNDLRSPSALRPPPTLARVAALTTQTAQLMVNEVLDWRVVFLDRPLIPG